MTDHPRSDIAPDTATLLNDIHTFVGRFLSFAQPEHADAVTLWIAHTHAIEAADTTPRLSIQSGEKRSGKTRVLELLELLARTPVSTANITGPALFHLVAEGPCTVLFDEVDTVFTRKGSGAQDLRGLLNAGYRRGGSVTRVARGGGGVERFDVFAPVALAGIGALPSTVQDRSIVIRMRRRASADTVERLQRRDIDADVRMLRQRLSYWADRNLETLAALRPTMPDQLDDRATDIWEPLFAIAAIAGKAWVQRVTVAAVALSGIETKKDQSSDVQLLARIRRALGEIHKDRIPSADLVRALTEQDDAHDGTLDMRRLARALETFEIQPRLIRAGSAVFRGYTRGDFTDAFVRYLPPDDEAVTA